MQKPISLQPPKKNRYRLNGITLRLTLAIVIMAVLPLATGVALLVVVAQSVSETAYVQVTGHGDQV
jgi:hypothetical protein